MLRVEKSVLLRVLAQIVKVGNINKLDECKSKLARVYTSGLRIYLHAVLIQHHDVDKGIERTRT